MKATKIKSGEYQYKGYRIELMQEYADGYKAWHIYNSDDICCDAMETLRAAKEAVDRWES